jgi:type VI secretion system protein VasG
MAELRKALFGKLNKLALQSIESAMMFAKLRGNPYVELAHWLPEIVNNQDTDFYWILRYFELRPSRLTRDITASLEDLPRGSTAVTDFSAHIEELIKEAWLLASLSFGEHQIRTGHLVLAAFNTRSLRNAFVEISQEFEKIKPENLAGNFKAIVGASAETTEAASPNLAQRTTARVPPGKAPSQGPAALDQFTMDLTEEARLGRLDPIVGRDSEIRLIVDILLRRKQNNPILTGEAGVGKTAIVEGFAQRIADGEVPESLRDVAVRRLDLGSLQAGASIKGEFENRLRQVVEEVQSSPRPIILFIDEAHALIGAGGAEGTGDAANLLKPALARGTLRTIAATTWSEYKRYVEKDTALTRRFQVVQVDEPNEAQAILMMRGIASAMERHHRVEIRDEALEASVTLSHRYISGRQLPDKAVSLLDTACARVAVSQHAVPALVEDSRRRIAALETELDIIERERSIGIEAGTRRDEVANALASERQRLAGLEADWEQQRSLVQRVRDLRAELRRAALPIGPQDETPHVGGPAEGERRGRLEQLDKMQHELEQLQGEKPLVLADVDEQTIASVVSDWTGIPVRRMVRDDVETVIHLADILERRVIGQRHAHEIIAKRIQTSRAHLDNPNKPIGVFMLTGPSGVGKTETALALAEAMYGGEHNLITINMSEFQESHAVSTLKGAPPGYVGYGEGGVLTEAVRRKPYSVVLLDEVEKAHPDVHEIFLQVFDKGWMEDAEGREIDFKNTLFILTTNIGAEVIVDRCRGDHRRPPPDALSAAVRARLLEQFPASLLGRLIVIPYYPLTDEMLAEIVRLQLGRIQRRIEQNYEVPFTYSEDVVNLVRSRCIEIESGGRMIDAILTNTLLPAISRALLTRLSNRQPVRRIEVTVENGDFHYAIT